jgi:hypothetical protein
MNKVYQVEVYSPQFRDSRRTYIVIASQEDRARQLVIDRNWRGFNAGSWLISGAWPIDLSEERIIASYD